jgi:HTH-type transcriptional regulator, bacterioopsin transcriptional activator and related proteins
MSTETLAAVDPVLRVLVVGDDERIETVVDTLSSQFDSVSLLRERPLSSALERLEATTVHCVVCAFDERTGRSSVDRIRDRDESVPIVALADADADRALEVGATDVVAPGDSPTLLAARVRTAAERERYRLAANASVSRYRSMLEGSNAVVWVLDGDGDLAYATPATESWLGVTPDELERRDPIRFVHPDDRDDVRALLETVSEGVVGSAQRRTVRFRRGDGGWHVVDAHAVNRLADPLVDGVIVTITSAVPEGEPSNAAREILDRIDEAVFAVGPRWEFRYANDAALGLFEGDPHPGTVVWDHLLPSVRDALADRLQRARATGESVTFEIPHPDRARTLRVRASGSESGVIVIGHEADADESADAAERDRLSTLESVVDALDDGLVVLDGETVTLANTKMLELSGSESLVDRELEELFDGELAAAVRERAESPVVRWMDSIPGALTLTERRPVEVFVVPLRRDDRTLCVVRDRRRSATGTLAALEDGIAAIRDADSRSTVRQRVVESTLELTGAEFVGFYAVGESTLSPSAVTTRESTSLSPGELPAVDRSSAPIDVAREANGASTHDRRPFESFLSRSGIAAEQLVTVPVGGDVLLATSTEPLGFDAIDLGPLETLADAATVALEGFDHASRARAVERSRNTLETALDRIRNLRSVERELLQARTRTDVYRTLCEEVASLELDDGSVALAWIGEVASGNETVSPRARAGRGETYPETVSIRRGRSPGEPTGRTAATLEPTSVPSIADDSDETWREHALEHGLGSVLCMPIASDGFLHATLSVYADRPNGFDEHVRRLIEHLASVAAFAIDAVERRRALVADSTTELEFVLRDGAEPLSSVARRLGRPLEVRSVVPRSRGGAVVFAAVDDADSATVAETLAGAEAVESVRAIGERGDDALVELVLAEPSIASVVADRSGVVRSLTPTDDRTRFVVDLSSTVDVRSFVRLLEQRYPGTELLARRERDRSLGAASTFEATLRERLSERQRRTLEAAYYGGFFEWPRESTGEEIADSLDVSQPTFSRHVRVAQSKLFSLLFEEFDGLE